MIMHLLKYHHLPQRLLIVLAASDDVVAENNRIEKGCFYAGDTFDPITDWRILKERSRVNKTCNKT